MWTGDIVETKPPAQRPQMTKYRCSTHQRDNDFRATGLHSYSLYIQSGHISKSTRIGRGLTVVSDPRLQTTVLDPEDKMVVLDVSSSKRDTFSLVAMYIFVFHRIEIDNKRT